MAVAGGVAGARGGGGAVAAHQSVATASGGVGQSGGRSLGVAGRDGDGLFARRIRYEAQHVAER